MASDVKWVVELKVELVVASTCKIHHQWFERIFGHGVENVEHLPVGPVSPLHKESWNKPMSLVIQSRSEA